MATNPDRRPLPDGWKEQYDAKYVSLYHPSGRAWLMHHSNYVVTKLGRLIFTLL